MTTPTLARKVYALVRRIPVGQVATYGQIAALAGHPGAARAVGSALARLPQRLQNVVPWHRVVTTAGLSKHRDPDGAWRQRDLLRAEGIDVAAAGAIDLERFGWDGGLRRPRGARGRPDRSRKSAKLSG